jgi:hypothetical protein
VFCQYFTFNNCGNIFPCGRIKKGGAHMANTKTKEFFFNGEPIIDVPEYFEEILELPQSEKDELLKVLRKMKESNNG